MIGGCRMDGGLMDDSGSWCEGKWREDGGLSWRLEVGGWCECRRVQNRVMTADRAMIEDKWRTDGGRMVRVQTFRTKS